MVSQLIVKHALVACPILVYKKQRGVIRDNMSQGPHTISKSLVSQGKRKTSATRSRRNVKARLRLGKKM